MPRQRAAGSAGQRAIGQMSKTGRWSAAVTRFLNRFHARMAARARPATAFLSQPEPRSTGSFARGKGLLLSNPFSFLLYESKPVIDSN